MDAVLKWNMEKNAKEIVEILNDAQFDAHYAQDVEEAKKIMKTLIPEGASIAVGGSVTLNETGIMEEIVRSPKYNFIDRFAATSYENMLELYREGLTSDVFISSVNAITKDAQLVLMDCTGNRVSSVIFGPKKVIIVSGVNKVCENLEEGLKRIKKVAPLNARRLPHKQAPCYEDGVCKRKICKMHERVCNAIGVVDGCYYTPGRISVIIVPENLGY